MCFFIGYAKRGKDKVKSTVFVSIFIRIYEQYDEMDDSGDEMHHF